MEGSARLLAVDHAYAGAADARDESGLRPRSLSKDDGVYSKYLRRACVRALRAQIMLQHMRTWCSEP